MNWSCFQACALVNCDTYDVGSGDILQPPSVTNAPRRFEEQVGAGPGDRPRRSGRIQLMGGACRTQYPGDGKGS